MFLKAIEKYLVSSNHPELISLVICNDKRDRNQNSFEFSDTFTSYL